MNRALHLSPVRRSPTARIGVVGATQLDYLPIGILDDLITPDEIRVTEPDFTTRSHAIKPLFGVFLKIASLNVEFPTKGQRTRFTCSRLRGQ